MNFTLSREERFRKKADFDYVFRNSRKVSGKLLTVFYAYTETGLTRAGFVVSKKVSLRAVERNRIKRILKNIYRQNRHLLPKGLQLVFRASHHSSGANYQDLYNEVLKHIKLVSTKKHTTPID